MKESEIGEGETAQDRELEQELETVTGGDGGDPGGRLISPATIGDGG
jgi:hypothetical protein